MRGCVPEQGADVNAPAARDRVQRLRGLAGVGEPGRDGLSNELADVRRIALSMIENPRGGVGWFLHWQVVGHAPPLRVGVAAQVEADVRVPGLGAAEHDELVDAFGHVADGVDGRRAGARDDRIRFGESFAYSPPGPESQPRGVDLVVRAHAGPGDPVQTVPSPLEPATADGAPQIVIVSPGHNGLGARDEPALPSSGIGEGAGESTLPHQQIILRNCSVKPYLQYARCSQPDYLSRYVV